MTVVALIVGLAAGAFGLWLWARGELRRREALLAAADEKLVLVERTQSQWEEQLKALTHEALSSSSTSLLELAEAKLQPIKETLTRFDLQAQALEQKRLSAVSEIDRALRTVSDGQERLRKETGNLVTALRAPHVRGRWGEIQLKRVVELAGMIPHCDFQEQATTRDGDGALLIPDLVVNLPGGKRVVVDAKAPLAAYLDALEAEDEPTRKTHVQLHARQVREHIGRLAAKRYWQQFEPAPEFVIMFLPDETFFRVACEADPSLLELGPESGVLASSPTTLIGLLKVFAYAWQQETIAEDARDIAALGRELYERLGVFASHFSKVGRALGTAVSAYNDATGSLERRLLVTARKFEEHGAASGELGDVESLEKTPVPLTATELTRAELTPPAAADAA
jgi:DNA recombination protein RmuC